MVFRFSTERPNVATALALALFLTAGAAQAAPSINVEAEAELRRGIALRRAGKDSEALEVLQHALALAPSPRALAQVALAEQALSLWLAAERDLGAALASTQDPWIKQNYEVLAGAQRGVESRLAWMVVRTNVAASSVVWNGNPAAPQPDGRVRLVAGQVVLEARAEGYVPFTRTLRIAPETTEAVDIDFQPDARPPAAALRGSAPARRSGSSRRLAGWIVSGAGIAILGVGAAFGVRAITKKSERDDDCAAGCSNLGIDADRAGRSAGLVSTVAVAVGAVATGAGLLVVLTAPASSARTAASVRVRLLGPSLTLSGSF